jgi:hypothetical protein
MNSEFLEWPIYGFHSDQKRALLGKRLADLTDHHRLNCVEYARILEARCWQSSIPETLESLPWLPVRLFKMYELGSVPKEQVVKTLTSSGTTGQLPSRILLDKITASFQTTALVRIMQEFLGKARLPMLIIDYPGVIKDRSTFSARGAGILGLSNFGRAHVYALNDDMTLNLDVVRQFARQYSGMPKLIFGFTFMVWQHFLLELERGDIRLELDDAILFHSGGWKKLEAMAVDNAEFKRRMRAACGENKLDRYSLSVKTIIYTHQLSLISLFEIRFLGSQCHKVWRASYKYCPLCHIVILGIACSQRILVYFWVRTIALAVDWANTSMFMVAWPVQKCGAVVIPNQHPLPQYE